MSQLYVVDSPITREQRQNINATFEDILFKFSQVNLQISVLAGGQDVLDLLERMQAALEDSIQTTQEAKDATQATVDVTNEMIQLIDTLTPLLTQLESQLPELETALNEYNTLKPQLESLKQDLRTLETNLLTLQSDLTFAIQASETATTNAVVATTNANQAYEAIKGWTGATPWLSGVVYAKNNVVTYNGSCWQAKRGNTGVTPVAGDDWILLAQRGTDGQGAVASVNGILPDENGNVVINIDSGKVKVTHFDFVIDASDVNQVTQGSSQLTIKPTGLDLIDLGTDVITVVQNSTVLYPSSNGYQVVGNDIVIQPFDGDVNETTYYIHISRFNVQAGDGVFTVNGVGVNQDGNIILAPSNIGAVSTTEFNANNVSNANRFTQIDEAISEIKNSENQVAVNVSGLNREVAYLKLKQDASERIDGGVLFADGMNGSSFGMEMKSAKTITNVPLVVGETVLTGKIGAVEGGTFEVGSKVTVMDSENSEKVTVTRSETVDSSEVLTAINEVVVASAYSTVGNGGRKIVRLDDGTLVCATGKNLATNSSKIFIYKSVDDGVTWEFVVERILSANTFDFSIVNVSDKIGLLYKSDENLLRFCAYNVDGTVYKNIVALDTNQTAIGNVSLAYDKVTNTLHAAWASKNTTYPNSFNIRYSKSVDGGATWSAVEQVTKFNSSGTDYAEPSISVFKGNQRIAFSIKSVSSNTIYLVDYKDGVYANKAIYSAGVYSQSAITSVMDKNDNLYVAWHGTDSTSTSINYIRFSKLTTESTEFIEPKRLYVGTNASITADSEGNLFIAYENASSTYYIKSTDDGDNWSNPTLISAGTNPSTIVDNSLAYAVPPTVQTGVSNVLFNGGWTVPNKEYHLECSPLTKAYNEDAIIAESTINPNGTFMNTSENTPTLTATATYTIPSTDYVGTFVEVSEGLTATCEINGISIVDGEPINNEYLFEHTLTSKQPIEMTITLTKPDANNAGRLKRILGGIA